KAYPPYKAQREETPEAIRFGVPYIKEILKAYNIPILEVSGYEADDVIGTLAWRFSSDEIEVFMMTPDKDYGQLVRPNVWMYRPQTGDKSFELLGEKEVCAKYGIQRTDQVIDLLGLMGDASDNIPGCPGVGEKTAQKLIKEFGNIENLLEHTDQLKGALKTKVETNREQITFSKFLATIKTDVPINLDMEALKYETPNLTTLKQIFDELEFRTLYDRVLARLGTPKEEVTQDIYAGTLFATSSPTPAKAVQEAPKNMPIQGDLFAINPSNDPIVPEKSILSDLNSIEVDYQLIDTEAKRQEIIEKLLSTEIFALDTETTGTEPMMADLVGMSFCDAKNMAYYVPVPANHDEALKIVQAFKPVFENVKSVKVGQNIKYDMIMLHHYGVEVKGPLFDTMLAHYVLQPELRHNMDYLAEIYLHYKTIHIDELIGAKGKNQKNMRDLEPIDIYRYACEDADVTLQLKSILEEEMKKEGVEQLFYEIEMPLVPVLVNMETNGVLLDTEALKQTSVLYNQRMNEIEQEIYKLANVKFNISSPKQVGDILFKDMKLIEKPKKTKTGQYVTSEEVLESLRHKHPIVGKILEY
ncbi:MAG: DNA polymerase, partial [Bacteroidales bacterium]